MKKATLALLFTVHLILVLSMFSLFFIPLSWWPQRITFHFFFILIIILIELLWSFALYRKIDLVCPLTTWMQQLRGFPKNNPKNYAHSFIAECLGYLHLKVPFKAITYLLIVTLITVTLQYLHQTFF